MNKTHLSTKQSKKLPKKLYLALMFIISLYLLLEGLSTYINTFQKYDEN